MKRRRYRSVVSAVYGSTWLMRADKLAQICALLDERQAGLRLSKAEIQQRIGAVARPLNRDLGPQASRVAVLNLFGVLSQRMNLMAQVSGGTSLEQFGSAFDASIDNAEVKAVVLNFDSPGGTVHGVPETAAKILAARGKKPIIAIANSQMDSAAYWLGSAADKVYATQLAGVGNIGAVVVHSDQSGLDSKAGVKRTIITSAPFKAEGNPYEPLGDDSRKAIQARVQQAGDLFVETVARHRGVSVARVLSDFGQGRELTATDALAVGMIDRIASLEELLAELGVDVSASSKTTNAAAPPAAVFSLENLSMDKKIFEALVRMGVCSIDAAQDVAAAALAIALKVKGFGGKHDDVPAVLAALGFGEAAPAAPPSAPQAAAAVADTGMSAEDILAAIAISPLSAETKLSLQSELVAARRTLSVREVLSRINGEAAKQNPPTGATTLEHNAASIDKFSTEARDALLCRQWGNDLPDEIYDVSAQAVVEWQPAASARRPGAVGSLPRLARQCLVLSGVPAHQVDSLALADIARIICGSPLRQFGISASAPAFNVSGMFSNILLDAQNITLRRSYMEAKTTFQVWMRQAESIVDFKNVNRIIAGELGDPKAVPEDGEFEETTFTDGKERYKLTTWGQVFSISWEAIVNDILQAFTRIPTMQGQAMRRKQNKLGYGVLLDNAALADGIALFDANSIATPGHNNLVTGAATPTVATLNVQYKKMAEMPGLNTANNTVLNIEPKWILAPPALRGTVLQLLGSTADPASTNAGVKNIWENQLTPVIDAQLGAAAGGSDTAWHLAADFNDIDTIEYAYLQGLETPALEQEVAFNRLALRYRIYQAFAVKAIDFRGLQKNAGA